MDDRAIDHRIPALSFGQSGGTSKAGISFPLGTGLVVLIILVVSALFSFCYHWLRLRKMGTSILPLQAPPAPSQAPDKQLHTLQCPPVVFMAGDAMPRFIALPCPLEAASHEQVSPADEQTKGQKLIDAFV